MGAYTDVYALAATLYELLMGEVPVSAFERQVNGTNLVSPQVKNPNISGKTTKAILAGMELLPEKRPQSVQAWLEKLNLKETSDRTGSTGRVNGEKWGVIWTAVTVVVTLLVGIPAWLTIKSGTQPETPNTSEVQPSP